MRTIPIIFAAATLAACAAPPKPDVAFQVDAFRAESDAPVQWVAWTDRGLETDVELLAARGTGCLPQKGWPQVIKWVPGADPGFWLFGTQPNPSGEDETVSFDCFVSLDGTTRPSPSLPFRSGDDFRPDWSFGSEPVPWRQRAQSHRVEVVSPNGIEPWELHDSPAKCWLRGWSDHAESACVGKNTVTFAAWQVTPNGIMKAEETEWPLEADGAPRGWMFDESFVFASADESATRVWIRDAANDAAWSTSAGVVDGTVLDAVRHKGRTLFLVATFIDDTVQLVQVSGTDIQTFQLPKHVRPTKLYRASDGTLWGAGLGAAWRLQPYLEP